MQMEGFYARWRSLRPHKIFRLQHGRVQHRHGARRTGRGCATSQPDAPPSLFTSPLRNPSILMAGLSVLCVFILSFIRICCAQVQAIIVPPSGQWYRQNKPYRRIRADLDQGRSRWTLVYIQSRRWTTSSTVSGHPRHIESYGHATDEFRGLQPKLQ
jgi:hypothetical protein